uniref:Meckelin n=1 Tax=Dunaliella tertiolecta TaxID=3047 RepID=A0A7S3QKR7_DUNTE|mmetsp:Transcript_22733/g.62790  ORF Transcript_22733/g.62790 Transcript_22733/m.62790 type:complete len:959 (+) Transcript_22733:121-2997(+)|eukprot:CAMPEP_0202395156 /NCGR_PEP_ID=MMETSP1127-20130417/93822_1 /ASSEMBLY_ACC=CAM_ASM_000462 /TAXON_ID=3047 /ORGANISM="Dunaliella tertiolecta, Strain CCMP1320" /LENGTH=958 /DNA_ID=CAMNT_0048997841 /DNA_START=1445 /DNA_END=4321 /DNA_ORIENTATION=+
MACLLLLIISLLTCNGQDTPTVAFNQRPCAEEEFFDTSLLACSSCPEGAVPSADQRSCVRCDSSSGSLFLFRNGFALTQEWTPASGTGGSCSCDSGAADSIVTIVEREGNVLQRCITCPSGTSPNSGGDACVPDSNTLDNTTPLEDLQFVIEELGLGINVGAATEASFPSTTVSGSVPLAVLLGPSAKACMEGQSRSACNAVANLCVLQLYDGTTGACRIYSSLVTRLATDISSTEEPRPATGPLPWLFYAGNQYSKADVGLKVHFGDGDVDTIESSEPVSQFTFILSAYAVNGTWLGFHEWQKHFQLCGIHADEGKLWRNFGWEYRNDCDVDLLDILDEMPKTREPVFYDAFLRTGPDTLYPVPVKVTNYDDSTSNNEDTGAVRRFFYVDGSLGTSQGSSPTSADFQVVQYPSTFRLVVTQRPDPTDEIFPPQIFITYTSQQVGSGQESSALLRIEFSVEYLNGGNLEESFDNAFNIMLIVFLVAIAFPVFCWKMLRAYRRRKDAQSDQDMFIYIGVALIDVATFALFLVVGLVGLYQLILYKMQAAVFFMIPRDEDLVNFRATVIVAIVGQAVGLLYMLWKQVTVDVFFLDWERPRKVLSRDGFREEDAEVSAWRLLFIANKFADLQTVRVTCPAFTLLMMVLILVGANVQNAGEITPKQGDFDDTYRTTQPSIVLRWGIQTAFFLVLFLGQYLFRRLLYFPYVSNPITNFVDLMYLANISAIILDERHVGSYIHGRNNAQHADTTLRGLNNELEKEGEGLVAHRGFVPTYQGSREKCENQVFQIYITEAVRRQYEATMTQRLAQVQNEARIRQGQMLTFLKGTGKPEEAMLAANDDVSALFREMINDVERNYATQVVDPSYPQLLLQLPPEASAYNTVFVHDYFRSFSETMFIGNEVRLFIFEALFFMAVDLALNNAAVTALITYAMVRAVALVRKAFGTLNISQKTTIDLHFLV